MFKKTISIILTIVIIFGISIPCFANTNITITSTKIGDTNVVVAEYKKGNSNIKTTYMLGYKMTTVTDSTTNEMDFYSSEYSSKYDVTDNTDYNFLVLENLDYTNDNYIGHYILDNSFQFDISPRQYLKEKYISDYSNSYYFRYTDDQYVLKLNGDIVGIFTTVAREIQYCTDFLSDIKSFDTSFYNVLHDGLSEVPIVSTVIAVVDVYNAYKNGYGTQELANAVFSAIISCCKELKPALKIISAANIVSNMAITSASYSNAKYNHGQIKKISQGS